MFQLHLQVLGLFHLFIQRPLQLPALVVGLIELGAQNHIVPHTHVNDIQNRFILNATIDPKFTHRALQGDCSPFFPTVYTEPRVVWS